jgi:hypothetical protein
MSFDVRAWVGTQTKVARGTLSPTARTKPGSTQYTDADGQAIGVVHETRSRTADTGPGPGPRTLLTLQSPGRDDLEMLLPPDVHLDW